MHSVGDSGASVPAFLAKLWKLVEDPTTDDLINWNENGVSFTIRDQARFARELLPLYYKHNNMASFVRQLNMYGFHKVVSVDSGGLKLDKDEMEFAHPYFLRGHEYLLDHIKRKIPISKQDEAKSKPELMSRILTEVRVMKGLQETVDSRLAAMKRENEALWREVACLRQKHMKQQQIVNKLIQFLISIVQPNGRAGLGMKRRYPLMLGEIAHSSTSKDKDAPKGETRRITSAARIKGVKADMDIPTISILSPTGPIIHDVTDMVDEVGGLGGLVEVPIDQEDDETPSTSLAQISEVSASSDNPDFSQLPIYDDNEKDDLVAKSLEEALVEGQPDFNTIVQMESGASSSSGSNLLENDVSTMVPSPMSPDLLVAVDPREVNSSSSLLSVEDAGRKNKENRGKSVSKKPDMQLVVGEPVPMEREEFDQHLDTIQVDLDNLREVLSLQGSPLDAATLLGLFNVDEPMNMPMSSYMSSELDAYRNTSDDVVGNQMVAYNSSLFELTDEDAQLLPEEPGLTTELKDRSLSSDANPKGNLLDDDSVTASASLDIAGKDVDLLELLGEPSSVKKKKAN